MKGAGVLTGDTLIEESTLIVGGAGATGLLNVKGNLDLMDTTVKMEIAGAAKCDTIECTKGTLSTAGTKVEVTLIGAPQFAVGNTLELFKVSGEGASWQNPFPEASVSVPNPGGGLTFAKVYLPPGNPPNNYNGFSLKVE